MHTIPTPPPPPPRIMGTSTYSTLHTKSNIIRKEGKKLPSIKLTKAWHFISPFQLFFKKSISFSIFIPFLFYSKTYR
jgi:hypothetical protein